VSLELNISKELLFEKRINPYKDENITELTVINFAKENAMLIISNLLQNLCLRIEVNNKKNNISLVVGWTKPASRISPMKSKMINKNFY